MSAIQMMRRAVEGVPAVIPLFNPMTSFCANAGAENAGVRFNNDGTIDIKDNCGTFSFDQNFLSVGGFAGAADDFEIMCSVNSPAGPTSGELTGVWLALTSSRAWNWDGFLTFDSGDWQLHVREVLNVSNFDSEQYTWQVEDGS